jgi:hypothetical protein
MCQASYGEVSDVGRHGAMADEQRLPNFTVELALRQQAQDLTCTR